MALSRINFWLFFCLWIPIFNLPLYAELDVFASFEDQGELNSIKASDGVRVSSSKRFPAWGPDSLEAAFPERGGQVELGQVPRDWDRQESLLIFAWSADSTELTLTLRDGGKKSFARNFSLEPGANHLQLHLDEVDTIDLRQMQGLSLAVAQGATLYLDYFALDRFHPVLEKRGRWDVEYSLDVETPHVQWARPLAGGPIQAYALSPVQDGRGIIELAQRLDLDFKATSIGRRPGMNKWGFGDFYRHRSSGGEFWDSAYSLAHAYIADDLLFGPSYEVILWPGIHPWESYPVEIRNEIVKRVKEGTGLVLFYPLSGQAEGEGLSAFSPLTGIGSILSIGDETANMDASKWHKKGSHYITRGVALDAFPWGHMGVAPARAGGEVLLETAEGNPVLAVGQLGRGRVVAFSYAYQGLIPEIDNIWKTGLHYPYHEYMWPLIARAVTWASQRESGTAISLLERSSGGLNLQLEGNSSGGQILARIRNSFGETEEELKIDLPAGQKQVDFRLPSGLQGGRHFAEVRVTGREGVHDWAALVFDTAREAEIRSIQPAVDRVEIGQPVQAGVELSAAKPVACTLKGRLLDNYDRLLDEQSFDLTCRNGARQEVVFHSEGVLTHLAKIDFEVLVNGIRSDRKVEEIFILQPRNWDDYDIAMYRFGPDPIPGTWAAIDAQLRRLHVTTLAAYSLDHSRHANYDIQAQTRITGVESPDGTRRDYYSNMKREYLQTRDKLALVRQYCFNDPEYQEMVRQELGEMLPAWTPFSPTSYYIYEEPSLTCYGDAVDICFSDHCMRSMRDWLKGEYEDLQAVNDSWGTDFKQWEAVVPDDTYEAQKRGNYASWADHRRFMEKTYSDSFKFVLDELRKYDAKGIVLNSGTQISGSHNGTDYSLLNRYTEHLNAYSGGNQLDFHRAFNPNLKISGGAGYGVLGEDVLYDFYSNLFKGANAGSYIFWEYSTLDPDLTLCQSGIDMAEGFQEMRGEGIGKLVGLATPENNGIAIHYSYPSIHGSWIVDGQIEERVSYHTSNTFDRFGENRDGWIKILRDAGLQFDFISYGDVEANALISKGYKALVLPMSVALSNEEVQAIRSFVKQGGTVIADALAGVMDEHNSFRPERALADVFGIRLRPGSRQAIISMSGEPVLETAGAVALAHENGKPILLHNRYGQGSAFLLNYFLDGYSEEKLEGENAPSLARMQQVLQAAGLKPPFRVAAEDGQAVKDVSFYLFNNGSTRLLGVVPDKEKPAPEEISIGLDRPAAIYDVREKRYLGTAKTFHPTLQPAVPELFAIVERPITGLTIEVASQIGRGEEVTIDFTVQGLPNLRSVAVVTIIDPEGRPVPVYGGNGDIIESRGSVSFRPALNDPTGAWRIQVTDAISGAKDQAVILVL